MDLDEAKRHPANIGRESLWDLRDQIPYIVVGKNSGQYSTMRDHTTRFALKDVVIYEYSTEKPFKELNAVGFADHISTIRKIEGLNYVNLKDDVETAWIGYKELFEANGVPRVSIKLQRSANVLEEIELIEQRLRNLNTQYKGLDPEEIVTRANKTSKLIARISDIVEHYLYIPYICQEELVDRSNAASRELQSIMSRSRMSGYVQEVDKPSLITNASNREGIKV